MALKDYIVDEVTLDCAEGLLSRREAMRRLGLMGLTGAAAAALLAACGDDDDDAGPTTAAAAPSTSAAATSGPPATTGPPSPTDPATAPPTTAGAPATSEEIRFSGPSGELIGVVAEAGEPRGAVLVIHENRGLTAHIRSIPQCLAADGYTA